MHCECNHCSLRTPKPGSLSHDANSRPSSSRITSCRTGMQEYFLAKLRHAPETKDSPGNRAYRASARWADCHQAAATDLPVNRE